MNPKIYFIRNLLRIFLDKIDYLILESIKDNIPESRNVFLKFLKIKMFNMQDS